MAGNAWLGWCQKARRLALSGFLKESFPSPDIARYLGWRRHVQCSVKRAVFEPCPFLTVGSRESWLTPVDPYRPFTKIFKRPSESRKQPFGFAGSRLSFWPPESRDRSFSGENHLFKLAVGTAAIPVIGLPELIAPHLTFTPIARGHHCGVEFEDYCAQ